MIYGLIIAISFVCLLTLLPILKNEYWIIRIWDYPRKQLLFLLSALLFAFIFVYHHFDALFFGVLIVGGGAELLLISLIFPYTKLAKLEIKNSNSKEADVSILISNVLMENEKFTSLIELVKEKEADIVMLVETDEKWVNALNGLEQLYPFKMHHPLSNTYGIMIYSKLKVNKSEYRNIVKDTIPSFHSVMELENGVKFNFIGLHPEPPFPTISETSAYRDAEILEVAKEIKESVLPSIVAGDLNDVAWSYTTKLFQKESKLLDPRKGRGFFSTFHASYAWARWPLDHVFVSKHFELVKMERLRNIESDHFPIYIALKYTAVNNNEEIESPTDNESEDVEKKLNQVDTNK